MNVLDSMLGIGACCIIVTTSGFCSVYLESMLKNSEVKLGIWHRNFQLALWSVAFLVITIFYETFTANRAQMITNPSILFSGWTVSAVVITLLNAGGGLLVAATLKYADSILKTLAISGSIVLSAILGWMLLGGQLDIFVILGCVSTIIAIFNYTFDASA
jgi:solute carrier family 35 (UDP-sugar transporter), member A1/2/3